MIQLALIFGRVLRLSWKLCRPSGTREGEWSSTGWSIESNGQLPAT
jgi:hypothetical protein